VDYEIDCIRHDSDKIITHVGIKNDKIYPVMEIVRRINASGATDRFFTNRNGQRVRVHARQRSDTGRWYLTTDPDSTNENNLDFLLYCR